jgi:protein arginine kinase activator
MELCQECHEKIATILFTQIVNNTKTVLHLCKDCAHKKGIEIGEKKGTNPVNDFLAGMVDDEESDRQGYDSLVCSACGLAYKEFRSSGKLGCGVCYRAFEAPLKKLLRKIHGNTMHHGKRPAMPEATVRSTAESISDLKRELAQCVEREDFEKAAELRDRIKDLERETTETAADERSAT